MMYRLMITTLIAILAVCVSGSSANVPAKGDKGDEATIGSVSTTGKKDLVREATGWQRPAISTQTNYPGSGYPASGNSKGWSGSGTGYDRYQQGYQSGNTKRGGYYMPNQGNFVGQSGYGQSGYGQGGYVGNQGGYIGNQGGYIGNQGGYGGGQGGYLGGQSGYGGVKGGQSGYGGVIGGQSGYGGVIGGQSGYGGVKGGQSGYGGAIGGLSGYGGVIGGQSGYGGVVGGQNGYGGVIGGQSGYGGAVGGYPGSQPGYVNNKGWSSGNSGWGGNVGTRPGNSVYGGGNYKGSNQETRGGFGQSGGYGQNGGYGSGWYGGNQVNPGSGGYNWPTSSGGYRGDKGYSGSYGSESGTYGNQPGYVYGSINYGGGNTSPGMSKGGLGNQIYGSGYGGTYIGGQKGWSSGGGYGNINTIPGSQGGAWGSSNNRYGTGYQGNYKGASNTKVNNVSSKGWSSPRSERVNYFPNSKGYW